MTRSLRMMAFRLEGPRACVRMQPPVTADNISILLTGDNSRPTWGSSQPCLFFQVSLLAKLKLKVLQCLELMNGTSRKTSVFMIVLTTGDVQSPIWKKKKKETEEEGVIQINSWQGFFKSRVPLFIWNMPQKYQSSSCAKLFRNTSNYRKKGQSVYQITLGPKAMIKIPFKIQLFFFANPSVKCFLIISSFPYICEVSFF